MPPVTLHAIPAANGPEPDSGAVDCAHEAARYAVLRRLGSAIRHQIAGALQPVSMMASMVERRIQKEAPDLEVLRRNCAEMSTLARSAGGESVALVGWLVPSQDAPIPVGQGIEECLHLLATELSLRGFAVANEAGEHAVLVARAGLRTLFPAALLALTDATPCHARVHVRCRQADGFVTVQLVTASREEAEPAVPVKGYRSIVWRDVRALAEADGIECDMQGDRVEFTLPVVERQPRADHHDRHWG